MKRILSVFLTAVTLLICLCSCSSKPDFVYGEYESKGTENTVYLKILSEGRAGFSYDKGKKATKRANYTYDKEEETITIQILGNGEIIAFQVENNKLIYLPEQSLKIEEINGTPLLSESLELLLTNEYPS